ncbi:unnamed protein product [Leptosia nina]|uniref:Uncharacterized protein n=1 Tax=Leptosia nina TaxID=320188 RepID=A0AAV1JHD4_9NEOP
MLVILACFISMFSMGDAARILAVYPIPSVSHNLVFRRVTQLINRGHLVTVITTDPAFPKDRSPVNLTEIDVHHTSYSKFKKLFKVTENKTNRIDEVKTRTGW